MEFNQIYCGDSAELMHEIPSSSYTIITDPPYNIGYKYSSYPDKLTDEDYINMMAQFWGIPAAIILYPEETMRYLVPSLGVPDEVLIWCYNSNIHKQSRLISVYGLDVHFDRVLQSYKNPDDKRIKKLIKDGSGGTPLYDWFSDIQLEKNVCRDKRKYPHPCPVPVKLIERIILLTTEPGDIVVDPFLGCGTTAIACIRTGRRYIGMEIDEDYFNTAMKRIEQEKGA
jgi:site-specific DNA-methyltransferase (adenine-specific)